MPRFIVRRCCANAACRRAAGVSRAISVDWLGQKAAAPAPSIVTSANACHGSRTSGSSPIPTACRSRARAERQARADPVDHRSREEARDELGGRGERDDQAGRSEPEAADVVQVDDEERQHDAVPEGVDEPADLQEPDLPRQARIETPERCQGLHGGTLAAPLRRDPPAGLPFANQPGSVILPALDGDALLARLRGLEIETPSWGYGNSGTRFHVFPWPGAARDVRERIADAALVHRLTGCCPTVALHVPWDRVDDWGELRRFAEDAGIRIGAINPNVFGDDVYRLGSLCNPDAARAAAGARRSASSASRSPPRWARRRSASGSPTARTTRARTTSARATPG